jgi:hypothetical protein
MTSNGLTGGYDSNKIYLGVTKIIFRRYKRKTLIISGEIINTDGNKWERVFCQ